MKEIIGHPGYLIDEYGRVFDEERQVFKNAHISNRGYLLIYVSKTSCCNGRYSVHKLVAIHYLNKGLNTTQIDHIDGNKTNNHFTNLEWVTALENVKRAWKLHPVRRYPDNVASNQSNYRKLSYYAISDDSVREIRKMLDEGNTGKSIALKYGVNEMYISRIKNNKVRKDVK